MSQQHPKKRGIEMSSSHPKKRRIEMSPGLNLLTATSGDSGSSTYVDSFNNNTTIGSNNTNFLNNTTNNVSNYFTGPEDRSEILAWLSPLEPRVRHKNIEASRVDKVGGWLLETKQFQSWWGGNGQDERQNATMLCYGNPGAGKTYICSLVVDTLCDRARGRDIAVTCFYFDFAAGKEQTPGNMLGALLKQIVGGLDKIPEEIMQEFVEQKKVIGGRSLQLDQIVKMLVAVTSLKPTFICVDAMDECAVRDRAKILTSLHEIIQKSPATRVFLTGRPHICSEAESRLPGGVVAVSISPWKDDLIHYIRKRLEEDPSPDEMDESLEFGIVQKIPEIVSEIFLLVSLNIEAILQEPTIRRRREKLRIMANGLSLENMYGATLGRIQAQGGERSRLGMMTLMWICHSERPLIADELCYALGVEIGSTDFDLENVPSIRTVLSCCQGLVVVDKEGSMVRLVHFTLREYLSARSDLLQKPHLVIAETCLTFLNSRRVMSHPATWPRHLRTLPFLEYSALYWGTHGKRELSNDAKSLALRLCRQYDDHISNWLFFQSPPRRYHFSKASPFTGLHCASFFGLVEVVRSLIEIGGFDINQGGSSVGMTPLEWAAGGGHEEVVQLLLGRRDVDPNKPDRGNVSALAHAAIGGHEGVVRLLLGRRDIDPNRPNIIGQTPLMHAASSGHEGVVRLLLGRGDINPEKVDYEGRTPLWRAQNMGHKGVVKLLLDWKSSRLPPPQSSET